MNQQTDEASTDLEANPATAISEDRKKRPHQKDAPQKSAIVPEISTFFTNPKISPYAFLRAIRAVKVTHFKRDDRERALAAIEGDPSGARLWALMSQSRLPQVVDHWIWPVAQDRLKSELKQGFDPDSMDSSEILANVCEVLMPRLRSKEKYEAKSAENWLRIALCWLIRTRPIDVWEIAEAISSVFFADTKKASALFHRAISKGNQKELRLSVATVTRSKEVIAGWKSDLAGERRVSDGLRIRLDSAENRNKNLSRDLAATREELAQKGNALTDAKKQFEDARHHWGHDMTETKTSHRRFLEQIKPLITDAVDELEMEPADPEAALKHLKAVVKKIQQEET